MAGRRRASLTRHDSGSQTSQPTSDLRRRAFMRRGWRRRSISP
ncbi:hypothetical protein E2C01_099867 [Portunus trituberculatus]|uniref:Uncharacterized protein n=1 Tax=Portunus trituberculatus TaxID=210409 RepID=A0A5B7K6L5_PORTR|nr:hypothetical protein [Portunus trituberculatus]